MQWTQVFLDSAIAGFLFNFGILVLMRKMPRGLLHMLPAYFRDGAKQPSREETLAFYKYYLPLLLIIAVYMLTRANWLYAGHDPGFMPLFLHGYVIAMGMNLGDAIFLDLVEIHTRRAFYGQAWGIAPDKLRAANFFKHLTFIEHVLIWPLFICPIIGCLYALAARLLI